MEHKRPGESPTQRSFLFEIKVGILCLLILPHWLLCNNIYNIQHSVIHLVPEFKEPIKMLCMKVYHYMPVIKVIFVSLLLLEGLLEQPKKPYKSVIHALGPFTMMVTSVVLLICLLGKPYWNEPLVFTALAFVLPYFVTRSKHLILGASKPEPIAQSNASHQLKDTPTRFCFAVQRKNGLVKGLYQEKIIIERPEQGIYIEGGAGSGKSASLVEPILSQAAQKGFAGLVYDYKGHPPTLSKYLYNALQAARKGVRFAHINMSNPLISHRCNPLQYLKSKLSAQAYAEAITKNLNPAWVKRQDFWADNAIAYLAAIIWYLRQQHPNYCTLPHVVALGLEKSHHVISLLNKNAETRRMIAPISTAKELGAEEQLSGVISSIQLPLNKLYAKEIFWVLTTGQDKGIDLDITQPASPTLLTMASDPSMSTAYSPALSLIATVCMQNMNQQGKHKSIFLLDEAPTLFIPKVEQLPATARANKVATIICVQDYAQLQDMYGHDLAKVIRANLGTQFYGMTNNLETARYVSAMIGHYDKEAMTVSRSKKQVTESASLKKDHIITPDSVLKQPPGSFIVKVGGTTPTFMAANMQLKPITEPVDLPAVQNGLTPDTMEQQLQKNFERVQAEVAMILTAG